VKSEAEISFRTIDGKGATISPVPAAQKGAGVEVYLSTDPKTFLLVIVDRICIDTMSGMPYPSGAVRGPHGYMNSGLRHARVVPVIVSNRTDNWVCREC
jgi:hypothetical protein